MSVTRDARRTQIVDATIDVIASDGFAQASFARIAQRAGLSSTRLISYHFAGKDELVRAVVERVVADIGAYMAERVGAASGAPAMLRAYIEGVIEFTDKHRARMRALLAIVLAGGLPEQEIAGVSVESHVTAILRKGQADGEFRDFDPRVVALVVQRAVEGLPFLLAMEPEFDTAGYARELVTLFELGTRR